MDGADDLDDLANPHTEEQLDDPVKGVKFQSSKRGQFSTVDNMGILKVRGRQVLAR